LTQAGASPLVAQAADGSDGFQSNGSDSCTAGTARANKSFPLERGVDFVPVTGNDDLGFWVVYSSRKAPNDPQAIGNNVGIFLFPLGDHEVLIFGSGYGDPAGPDSAFFDAAHDVERVDSVIRSCMGLHPAMSRIRFVAPHGHGDHINPAFIRELGVAGYQVRDISFHQRDFGIIDGMPWRSQDRQRFRAITAGVNDCGSSILEFDSPLGRIWFTLRPGHTNGSIDLVLDVRGDPTDRVVVLGSMPGGDCSYPGGVKVRITAHGNVTMNSGPEVVELGCGYNPPDSMRFEGGAPVLGNVVHLSLDNPTNVQQIGAIPILTLTYRSDANYPCGSLLQDLGLSGAEGELLVSASSTHVIRNVFGPPWGGPGQRVPFDLPIPQDPNLVGFSVYAQGTFLAPKDPNVRISLTDALQLRIGW